MCWHFGSCLFFFLLRKPSWNGAKRSSPYAAQCTKALETVFSATDARILLACSIRTWRHSSRPEHYVPSTAEQRIALLGSHHLCFLLVITLQLCLQDVLHELQVEVHYSAHEGTGMKPALRSLTPNSADHDIAIYARNNKCFAILSQDTDFLIFDVGTHFRLVYCIFAFWIDPIARYIPLDTVNFDAPGRISAECYSADRTAELLRFNKKVCLGRI